MQVWGSTVERALLGTYWVPLGSDSLTSVLPGLELGQASVIIT